MAESTIKILVTLGVSILLAMIGGLVKLGIVFGDLGARVKALEEDDGEDTCTAKLGELHERVDAHDIHLAQIDVRCDERSPVERTGKHILEG